MTIREFFREQMGRIAFQILFVMIVSVFLLATGTQSGVVVILLLTFLMVFLLVQGVTYWKMKIRLETLTNVLGGLDKRYLFAECAPRPKSLYERKVFELFRLSGKSMIEAVSDAETAGKEYREYIEQWVHEIKTPITAAKLICRNTDGDMQRKLSQELDQIDAHVERALFYARAETPEKDFIIRKQNLSAICDKAIQTHRTLLIQNNVRVETENIEKEVYTDDKWAAFMLGQILQNAVRYRKTNPVITLSGREFGKQVQLVVRDNGIGIPKQELSRVFDKGFTGSNGRSRGGSTGIGLYLCKKLAEVLGMELQIQSEEEEGTSVTLTFPAVINLSKM